jgi:hypothetical protein
VTRPQGGACDSGAAERPVPVVVPTPPGGTANPPGQIAIPAISAVSVSRTRFRAGPKVVGNPGKGKTPVGTTITFKLSAPATVKATVLRVANGRRVGGKCLAPAPATKGKPRCTRQVGVGSLPAHSFAAGRGVLEFNGRVGGRNLPSGRYLVVLAVPGSGISAKTPVLRIVAG